MASSGIYQIKSKVKPNLFYIGSAINIKARWRCHLSNLRKNKHHSAKLQNHYNKYGKDDLEYSVLLCCDNEELIEKEQFFIDVYNPYFNICPIAENCTRRYMSRETRSKISKANTGRIYPDDPRRRHNGQKKRINNGKMGTKYNCGGNNGQSKGILNLLTGIYYVCIKEAYESTNKNVCYERFARLLKNKSKEYDQFIYVD